MKKLFEAPEADILRLNVRDKILLDIISEADPDELEGEEDEF